MAKTSLTTDTGTLPAPPTTDPELDTPLTPLAGFDLRPVDESAYSQPESNQPPTTRYSYRIDGLDSLTPSKNGSPADPGSIRDQFHHLSALANGDGKAANIAMVAARMDEDKQLLKDILSGEGYFDAVVDGDIALPAKGENGPVVVALDTAAGPRYVLGKIVFAGSPVVPDDLITSAFVPKAGEPIVADRILAAEANLAVVLPENGYPFATIGDRDIALDSQTATGDYTLPVDPGPRSRFGAIAIAGDPVFKPEHIAVIARFKRGDLYDSRKVDDLRKALLATSLFAVASVEPRRSGEKAPDGTEYATLEVRQKAGPPHTLAAQAGYATGEGFKVEGLWTHRNLFPPEGALILNATAGTQQQGAGVTFRRSNAGRRDRSVELGLNVDHSDFNAFEAYTGSLSGTIAYSSTPIWQKRWTWSFGVELLASDEQDYDFSVHARTHRIYYVAALPGQITYDTSDSLLDPTRGFRLTAKISPETSLGSGAQVYARSLFEASGYYPASDGLVLAGRVRIGMIGGVARAAIAPSRRLYSGGGGSVRGFGYQEVGPKDPDNRPIGGRSLVEAASEVRYRFGDWGVAAFVDAGQVYTSEVPRFTDWRVGVGAGVRFYTNFGPMRLDVATPIDRQAGESRFAVYASIGQAF